MNQPQLRLLPARTLHIIFGDHSQSAWLTSCFPDPVLVWREVISSGPAIGLVSLNERAAHLESIYPTDHVDTLSALHRMATVIDSYLHAPEIVFWFGSEIIHQINLFYIISLLRSPHTQFSIVLHSTEYIASQSPQTRKALFDQRAFLSPDDVHAALAFWNAITLRSPETLADLSFDPDLILPFKQSQEAYLTRFPSTRNGLSSLEEVLIQGVYKGTTVFSDLYQYFLLNDQNHFGFDEWLIWDKIKSLRSAIRISVNGDTYDTRDPYTRNRATLALTRSGHQLLNCEIDYVRTFGVDRWIGGTHLIGHGPVWRCSEDRKLVFE
jgi:hypothetical protein